MPNTNTQREVTQKTRDALRESMDSLTTAHGCIVEHCGEKQPVPQNSQALWVVTKVAFESNGLQGSLTLAATQGDAHDLWPLHIQNTSPTGEDMVGEFANCLLGSLQTKLCQSGIEISMGTPRTERGSFSTVLQGAANLQWQGFRVRTATVFTSVQMVVSEKFQWQPLPDDADPPMSEGEALVF